MVLSAQERISSLKAGILSASCVGLVAVLCELLNHGLVLHDWQHLWRQQASEVHFLSSVLIASISGFLFGVTYRYIRRSDPNPHLRSGAIAAFGLSRGLAQLDMGILLQGNLAWVLWMAGESVVMMAIAAIVLDIAAEKHWIERIQ